MPQDDWYCTSGGKTVWAAPPNELDAWYYARAGETVGPISFKELQAKAADSMLKPPLEMVWTEGMECWTPAVEIEGLCETKGTQLATAPRAKVEDSRNSTSFPDGFSWVPAVLEARAAAAKARAESGEDATAGTAEENSAAVAKARAEEAARAQAVAHEKAEEEARARAAAEARAAAAQAQAEKVARARAAEEAAAAAKVKADEETRARAAAEARAAAAQAEAEEIARARAAEEAAAAAKVKADEEARAKAAVEVAAAKVKAEEANRALAAANAVADVPVEGEEMKAAEVAITEAEAAGAKTGKKHKAPSASAKCVWFYTCEGDRLGPVSFEELRAMAAATALNPRLDMVWKQSMEEWKPAGQIDGLFERRIGLARPNETAALPAVPIRPPQQVYQAEMRWDAVWPGARRRSFLLACLVFPFVWEFAFSAVSPFLGKLFGPDLMESILPAAAFVAPAVLIYFGLIRLSNLGMSRWWYLAICVPILNLWVAYRCFACPAGYAYHKKMDGPGIALAVLYGLTVSSCTLLLAALVAVFFGAIDSPELQAQLREVIRR